MSIVLNSKNVTKIETFISSSTIAKPTPPARYDNFQWKYKGKLLKDVYNEISGAKYPCDNVFLIDIGLLHFNFANRRIRIYLQELEAEKKQNPSKFKSALVSESNPEDVAWVKDLLLDRNEKIMGIRSNTEGFEQELIANGQLEPAVITIDGTLRNGNRRKAIFEDILGKITAKEKDYTKLDPENFKYLKVIILPRDINDEELFDLENFLQTKRDWKQPYDAITVLNIIKEAHDKYKLGFDEIKSKYLHLQTEAEIKLDYYKIKAMDKYLETIGKEGQYREIEGQQELFEDFIKYDFKEAGLAGIPREKLAQKQNIIRKREGVFFDMVSANQCNSEVLRPSDQAVRRMAQEIFKNVSASPEAILEKFYTGVDRTKLSKCETTNVERFAANIDSQVMSHQALNIDKAPLEKLKKIARDLNKFGPRERERLARKKETGKYIKLAKEGLGKIEQDIAKVQKKG